MGVKLRNPKYIIFVVVVLAVIWITYWIFRIPNKIDLPEKESEVTIKVPSISYEFVKDLDKSDDRDSPNDSDVSKTTEGQSMYDSYVDYDSLEHVEFSPFSNAGRKTPSHLPTSTFKKPVNAWSPKLIFKEGILIPRKKSNILLENYKTTASKDLRKDINDYNDDSDQRSLATKEPYILIHNAAASLVRTVQKIPRSFPVYTPQHYYTFTSKRFPRQLHLRPSIGNGFIGTVVHGPHVHISGLYSGAGITCHRSAIPSTASFNISATVPSIKFDKNYVLDVSTGVYREESKSEFYSVVHKIYAHRTLTNLLISEVDYEKKSKDIQDLTLKVDLNKWKSNQDFTFKQMTTHLPEVSYKVGILNAQETGVVDKKEIHIIYDHIPAELKSPLSYTHCKWVFLTAYGFTQEEVERHYEDGRKLLVSRDELYVEHVKGWMELWRNGRIEIEGHDSLAPSIYAGFYYLMSSVPLIPNNFVGVSPSGLPFGDELEQRFGRIRVDQELSIFPALLMLHPGLAKHIIASRNMTLQGAYINAKNNAINGLAFPYESASTGLDLGTKRTGFSSPHITAAVLFTIKQYLDATNDTLFVNGSLSKLIFDAADFLHSRLTATDETFHVLDQVPIDEETQGTVHDSLSGNALISRALMLPHDLYPQQKRFLSWKEDAARISLPKINATLHAAHSKYVPPDKVGEADVVMLNFPLMMNISKDVLMQDLNYYDRFSSRKSSPTSKALLAINWLGARREDRGDYYLRTLASQCSGPFKTWTSHANDNRKIPNHLSGIGAFLQTIVYGYGGFRVTAARLEVDPTIPFNVTSVHYVGVDYLNASINFFVTQQEISVMLTNRSGSSAHLSLLEIENNNLHEMNLGVQLTVKRSRIAIIHGSANALRGT